MNKLVLLSVFVGGFLYAGAQVDTVSLDVKSVLVNKQFNISVDTCDDAFKIEAGRKRGKINKGRRRGGSGLN